MITPMITQSMAQTVSASEFRRRIHKLRRQRELYRRYVLLVVTVIIIFLLTVSFHSFISVAHEEDEKLSFKYYTSIMIQHGETLWSIADAHMSDDYSNHNEYINEVTRINHLVSEDIIAGQYLIIPYYSENFVN